MRGSTELYLLGKARLAQLSLSVNTTQVDGLERKFIFVSYKFILFYRNFKLRIRERERERHTRGQPKTFGQRDELETREKLNCLNVCCLLSHPTSGGHYILEKKKRLASPPWTSSQCG